MAKSFSQQLQGQVNQQEQGRLTRSQRKAIKDYELRQQQKYEELRQQADAIRSSSFGNISSVDEYRAEFGKLSPELQPFFATPDEVVAEQEKQKQVSKEQANKQIEDWQQKVNEYNKEIEDLKAWWQRQRSSYKSDPSNKESYKEDLRRYKDDVDEYQDRIYYLRGVYGKIDQGFSLNDLIDYAENKASYQREKSEGKRQAIKQFEKDLSSGKLDETLSKLKLDRNTNFDQFNQSVSAYNKNIDYLKGLQNWAKKVGFENLPESARAKLNPSAVEFQKSNPTEKLYFDEYGNVTGVESKAFGQSLSIDAYNKKVTDNNKKISEQNKIIETQKAPDQLRSEAKVFLSEYKSKVDTTSFDAPDKSGLKKIWDYAKAGYLSSPFGSSVKLPESKQKEITAIRESKYLGLFTPYKLSLEAIKEADQSDYRAKEKAKLFEDLNKNVENAPDELKYYVQEEGLKLLKDKGLDYKIEQVASFEFKNGQIIGTKKEGDQIVVTDKDFDRRISQNILEWEKERKKEGVFGEIVLGTRIVSTKAVEFLGISKGVGFVIGKVGAGAKNLYTSLGGGLKFTDASVRAGRVSATIQSTKSVNEVIRSYSIGSILYKPSTISTAGKLAFGGSLVGLYGFSKYQQYQSYKQTSEVGKEVFALETGGELLGFGTVVGTGLYDKYQTRKINQRIAKENALLEQKRAGLKNIKDYGQFSNKASLKYEQVGMGKPVKLGNNQLKVIAKEYSKVTGISQKDALRIIREKSLYKTTLKVKGSGVPSVERALKYLRTGKASQGKDVYEISRYGFTDQVRTNKGVQEIGFEFNLKGSRISNIQLKTTVGEDKSALTSIFEKARYSKKTPEQILRLKETVLTKVLKMRSKNVGSVKMSLTETENRLLNTYPYGKERFSLKEALKLGLEKGQIKNFDDLWQRAGNVGKSADFKNLRMEMPLWKGKSLKVAMDDEYQFLQKGTGKRSVPLKNFLYDLEKAGYFKDVLKAKRKPSSPIYSSTENLANAINKETAKASSSAVLKETIKQKAIQNVQVTPTVQSFAVNTKVALKEILTNTDKLLSNVALGLSSESGLAMKSKQRQDMREDMQQRSAQEQTQRLMQDLGVKQAQQQKIKQTSIADLIQELQSPRFQVPELVSPRVPITETPAKPFKFVVPEFDLGFEKAKLKRKIRQKKVTELGLLPDFTSRIIGLDAEEFNLKDIDKAVRNIQTGFEVRSGAKVKGFNEKDLLREVMLKL